jgi:hypothetical protein
VSLGPHGAQAAGGSISPAISADGRFVAFVSDAANLVRGDTNGYSDVFVHDRRTGGTTRVSVSSRGRQGNRGSYAAAVSASGRYVAFCSYASNLAGRDRLPRGLQDHELEPYRDVFVHDRVTGQTERVSVGLNGQGNNFSGSTVSISGDGRFVAFDSHASNLVGGDTGQFMDVFVHDRQSGITERVSVSGTGVRRINTATRRPSARTVGSSPSDRLQPTSSPVPSTGACLFTTASCMPQSWLASRMPVKPVISSILVLVFTSLSAAMAASSRSLRRRRTS